MALLLASLLLGCSIRDQCVISDGEGMADVAPSLRYDGVYQSDKFNNYYWKYLRFHPNGKVIAVSAVYTPDALVKKLNDESAGVLVGVWTQNGKRISFSCVSSTGEVKYEGQIESDHLLVRSHSLINGHRSSTVYRFVGGDFPD